LTEDGETAPARGEALLLVLGGAVEGSVSPHKNYGPFDSWKTHGENEKILSLFSTPSQISVRSEGVLKMVKLSQIIKLGVKLL
jgi:hypothetical protein